MTDDIIRRLREAIAAGPSPGEWRVSTSVAPTLSAH